MKMAMELTPRRSAPRRTRPSSGKDIVAWEYRTPSAWFEHSVGIFTVLSPDRLDALQYVYSFGKTSKDIGCGLIDLEPITRAEAKKLGRKTPPR